jgi:hypothetical protein
MRSSSIIFNYWLGLDLYQACSLDDLYFFWGSDLFLFVDKQIEVALAFELQVDLDQRFDGQAHVSWLMCCMGCMVCMICMGCMCCCQSRSHFTWFQSRFDGFTEAFGTVHPPGCCEHTGAEPMVWRCIVLCRVSKDKPCAKIGDVGKPDMDLVSLESLESIW